MSDCSDVTITLCTLNEARNISEFLASAAAQQPAEIVVVDASSDDGTADIAARLGARVIVTPRLGLAHQRRIAVEATDTRYVALLDADHRPEPGSIGTLVRELEQFGWDGIEAQILSTRNTSYWDAAMEFNFEVAHNFVGPRRMIGTPCVYRAEVLKRINFDPFFTASSDDTDLCYRLVRAGRTLGVGTPVVRQVHRSTRGQFVRKWLWYGKGDAQFVWRHPERAASIVKHQLVTYALVRPLRSLAHGRPQYAPFFVAAGALRHVGMLRTLVGMAVRGAEDRNIVST